MTAEQLPLGERAYVRCGSYFLQGQVGWGPKRLANVYTPAKAEQVAAYLRERGFRGARVEMSRPSTPPEADASSATKGTV